MQISTDLTDLEKDEISDIEMATISESTTTTTANGAITNSTTSDPALDLFFIAGASRSIEPEKILELFHLAFRADADVAIRIALWARDARSGAGERRFFRIILRDLAKKSSVAPSHLNRIIDQAVLLGRWDDIYSVFDVGNLPAEQYVIMKVAGAIRNDDSLCAKWAKRKGPICNRIRRVMNLTPKQYRKTLVELSDTVEQKMCANEWGKINYSSVPSVAMSRLGSTFGKHDQPRFGNYLENVNNGTEKINASVAFPHDITRSLDLMRLSYDQTYLDPTEIARITAQWNALPDYIGDNKTAFLPLADVSGSMNVCVSGKVTALDVCVGLTAYMAEKNNSAFKDVFITFSEQPAVETLNGNNIVEKLINLAKADWGMSTNFDKAIGLVLERAILHNVPAEDMPKALIVLSDMEFNQSQRTSYRTNRRNALNTDLPKKVSSHRDIAKQYAKAGYTMPSIVYWNLNGSGKNNPVTQTEDGTVLVSGFSPSMLKTLLSGEVLNYNPKDAMLEIIMDDRYKV